jgi:hypothetical protein
MTADFSERYALIAMPVICLAAAFAFAPRDPGGPPRQAAAPAPEELPAATPAAPARSAATPTGPATDGPAARAGPATPAASPATPPAG